MPTKGTTVVTARVKNEDYEKFKAIAEKRGLSPNGLLNKVVMVIVNGFKPAPFEYKELLKACDRCGLPYQRAVDLATQAVDEMGTMLRREALKKQKEELRKKKEEG